jgi:hypothetical protein
LSAILCRTSSTVAWLPTRYQHLRRVKQLTTAEMKIVHKAQRDAAAEQKADDLIREKAREVRRAFMDENGLQEGREV